MRVRWALVERLGFYLVIALVIALGLIALRTGILTLGRPGPDGAAPAVYERPARMSNGGDAPPIFVHFFDWFLAASWDERAFVDPFDWEKMGIRGDDRRSEEFYQRQFVYMRSLGIDAVAWEFHGQKGARAHVPLVGRPRGAAEERAQDCAVLRPGDLLQGALSV